VSCIEMDMHSYIIAFTGGDGRKYSPGEQNSMLTVSVAIEGLRGSGVQTSMLVWATGPPHL